MWWTLVACTQLFDPAPDDIEIAGPTTCDPELATTPGWPVEGDAVSFRVRCTGLAASGFDATIEGYPLTLTPGGDGWQVDGVSGLEDAGTYAVTLSIVPKESPETPAEIVSLDLDIADAYNAEGNVPPDPALYTREFGLPVLSLFPEGSVSTNDTNTEIWLDGELQAGQMHIRGASSAGYSKPGYTIEVEDEFDLKDWGMGEPNHLLLVSTFDDNSYVRQKLCYDTWADIAAFYGQERLTPRTHFVVLYLGGQYNGLFLALDRIDDRFLDDMGLDNTGNLYKAVDHNANFRLTDTNGNPKGWLGQGYEQKEGDATDFSDLIDLVTFTGSATADTFPELAANRIDVDEFLDWYIFVHYLAADDSAGKNSYLYHDPTTGRFRYAPWDFNHSFGQNWYTARVSPQADSDFRWNNRVFELLQDNPTTAARLAQRWDELTTAGPLHSDAFIDRIDAYEADISLSAARDWEKWDDAYYAYGGWSGARGGDWQDHEGERAYLRDWLVQRDAWAANE